MPIQLKDPHSDPKDGLIIDKGTVKAMVSAYRTKHEIDSQCLKFVHFNLMEVIQLFIDNAMIDPSVPLTGQMKGLQYAGLKIYLGTHLTEADSPTSTGPGPNPYIGMDTAIICNTQLNVLTKTWEDQLLGKTTTSAPTPATGSTTIGNSISIVGLGEGLDRGSICPPSCPSTTTTDPDGFFQQDIA